MKVTLNLSKLLESGHINQDEYNRLVLYAKKETSSLAVSILIVLACIAIAVGFIGLNSKLFFEMLKSLHQALGTQGIHVLIILSLWTAGAYIRSGFLIGLSCFVILSLLGGSALYSHASYFVAIREPALTILVFSALSLGSLYLSERMDFDKQRLLLIFSRTSLIIINMGFWIGSLWGSHFFDVEISRAIFSVGWAIGILGVGYWGASQGRRFVVNTCAGFGSIHFYTQWFETLGASPGSLLLGGVIALAIVYGVRRYNT